MITNNRIRHATQRLTGSILCLAAFAATVTPAIMADEFNKETVFTFSGPVEIPGKVLPAGTYVFKLLDSDSDRNIVQVFDKDEKKVYATLLAVSSDRIQPSSQTIVRFEERRSNEPEAVKGWYYPGEAIGWEFVYPHERATALAKRTKQRILSMKDEMKRNTDTASTSADDPATREMQRTQVSAVDPSGKDLGPVTTASK